MKVMKVMKMKHDMASNKCRTCGAEYGAAFTNECGGKKVAVVATNPLMLARVWEAFEDRDKTEGKSGSVSLGLFFQKTVAEAAARGKGVMGGNGAVLEVWMVTADKKVGYRVVSKDPIKPAESLRDALRERALSKLTAEERDALGVS